MGAAQMFDINAYDVAFTEATAAYSLRYQRAITGWNDLQWRLSCDLHAANEMAYICCLLGHQLHDDFGACRYCGKPVSIMQTGAVYTGVMGHCADC